MLQGTHGWAGEEPAVAEGFRSKTGILFKRQVRYGKIRREVPTVWRVAGGATARSDDGVSTAVRNVSSLARVTRGYER